MSVESMQMRVTTPESVDALGFAMVHDLRREVFGRILSEDDLDSYLRTRDRKVWDNPNKSPVRTSRRAQPGIVAVTGVDGRLVGSATFADDASARLPFPLARLEQATKLGSERLHRLQIVPPAFAEYLSAKNFLWIGEDIARPDSPDFLYEAMIAAITATRDGRAFDQRVTCYPYPGEDTLTTVLESSGFESGAPQVADLGEGHLIEGGQIRYEHPSARKLHEQLMATDLVAALVNNAIIDYPG